MKMSDKRRAASRLPKEGYLETDNPGNPRAYRIVQKEQ
jgi:hypothetical protein